MVCTYNFGVSGTNLMKIYQAMCREAGAITWYNFWKGCHQHNLGGPKMSKKQRNFYDFRIWSQISLEGIDTTKIWKVRY